MTTFRLTVSMDGAAFEDDPGELARILRVAASRLPDAGGATSGGGRLLDVNGNTCGEWSIGADDAEAAEAAEFAELRGQRDERAEEIELEAFLEEHPSAEVLDEE